MIAKKISRPFASKIMISKKDLQRKSMQVNSQASLKYLTDIQLKDVINS